MAGLPLSATLKGLILGESTVSSSGRPSVDSVSVSMTVAPVMLADGRPLLPRNVVTPPLKLKKVVQHGDIYVSLTYDVPR